MILLVINSVYLRNKEERGERKVFVFVGRQLQRETQVKFIPRISKHLVAFVGHFWAGLRTVTWKRDSIDSCR